MNFNLKFFFLEKSKMRPAFEMAASVATSLLTSVAMYYAGNLHLNKRV